jgi:hypothetical protein
MSGGGSRVLGGPSTGPGTEERAADYSSAPLAHPMAQRSAAPASPVNIVDQFGRVIPPTNDPAWQPPRDTIDNAARARAQTIYREIPISTVSTEWDIRGIRDALQNLLVGLFDRPAQLVDAIVGDDRVQATLGSRLGGLFGREVRHKPANDSAAAREVFDAWVEAWPRIALEDVMTEIAQWGIMIRVAPAQVLWDTSRPIWTPHPQPWHPRYAWYHFTARTYLTSTLDGLVPIVPGDGKWLLHTPRGQYRGWLHGAVRAIAQPWIIRNFAYRDWARYSERHGMPIMRAYVPAASDPTQRAAFVASVQSMGQETAIMLPKGVDDQFSYDLDMLEATDRSWESFPGLIDRCDMSIVLALLFQNLTTEVKEGSFAAARVHADVRQAALASDNRALAFTVRRDLARPFAAFNFGEPELAPYTDWDIDPIEDKDGATKVFLAFSQAVQTLAAAGYEFQSPDELVAFAFNSFALRIGRGALRKVQQIAAEASGKAAPSSLPSPKQEPKK